MSKKVNHRFEPELRFPEFKGTPQWEKLPIGEKVELLSGYPFKSQDMTDDPDGTPLLRGINITEGHIRHSKDIDRYIAGDVSAFKKYLLKKDDLVIGMDGSKVGKNSALVSADDAGSLLIQRVARLRSGCNSTIQFIYQHVHSSIFHSYVDRINTSGGIPHISAKQINDFEICFPEDTREQQKIADCLSSLDGLIAAHTQKHQELQSYKKGLLQNLFPAEGQAVPVLRFSEFKNSGEWGKFVLGEVATFSKGKGISKADIEVGGKTPCIRYGELYTLYGETIEEVVSFTNVPVEALVLSKQNDVIIPASGETQEDIATASCVKKEDVALGGDLNIIRSNINGVFLSYYLNSAKKYEIAHMAQGISVIHLYPAQLKVLEIYLPKESSEQQKIAEYLSSVDGLILSQSQKIKKLKEHKKGLMQQLFPSVDEVGP